MNVIENPFPRQEYFKLNISKSEKIQFSTDRLQDDDVSYPILLQSWHFCLAFFNREDTYTPSVLISEYTSDRGIV